MRNKKGYYYRFPMTAADNHDLEGTNLRQAAARHLSGRFALPLLAASVLLVLLMNLTPLVGNDFWTQIKVGEIIRETGEIPDTVLFAFGEGADREFIAYEWLPSVGMSWIHSHFGVEGAIVVRALVALLVFALLVMLSLQINRDLLLSVFIAIASLLVISNRFFIRPELFSFVFGLVELNLLQAFTRTKDRRWLFALIPLAALWANCHGSFPVGIALPLIFATGALADELLARWRAGGSAGGGRGGTWLPFAAVGFAMAGASLANPFGWDLFDKVLGLVQSGYIRSSIVEWTPVYAVDFVKTKSFVFYILYFLLLADSLVQRTANQPVRIYLLAVIFLVLSIDANRNVAWFAVAGSYVLAHTLDRSPRLTQRRERNTVWFAAVLLIGSLSTLYFGNVAGKTLGLRDESPLSAQATAFIRDSGYSGNVFNTYIYGGKLAYNFYPRIRITIDDRIDAYGEDYYREFQRFEGIRPKFTAAPGDFIDYFKKNELNLIVVRTLAIQRWRTMGRLSQLYKAGWKQVYQDVGAWILRRDPDAPSKRNRRVKN